MRDLSATLLMPGEPLPWCIEHTAGHSDYFLICDHAGNRLPRSLGTLGLDQDALASHIAWDIGAGALASALGDALDACVVLQPYSRLVIDCNRPLDSADSIVSLSESTPVPGNRSISDVEAAARICGIFIPYHARIRELLDARLRDGQRTLLIALHSFTPVYQGVARPWHAAVLYNRDPRLARLVAQALRDEGGLLVGENEPYAVNDDTDYAIPHYGEARGLAHVELEIRQDLIADAAGQSVWTERLARLLRHVHSCLAGF